MYVAKFAFKTLLIFTFIATTLVKADGSETFHIVIKNETLSGILHKKNYKPIYSENGYLNKVLFLNPRAGKGNKIYPGERIILPKKMPSFDSNLVSHSPQQVSDTFQDNVILNVEETKRSRSNLNFSLSNRFVKIKSNDYRNGGQATLLSDSSLGYNLSWGQNWSDRFNTYFYFENYNVRILDSSTPTKSLSNTTQSLTSYAFGLSQLLTPKTKFLFDVNYGESIVYRAESSSLIVIEKFQSAKLNPGFSYTFLSRDELKLYSLINLIVALPSTQETYSSRLSYGHKLGLGVEDRLALFKIKGELFYNILDLKMSESNFEQTETGVYLGFNYQFGVK